MVDEFVAALSPTELWTMEYLRERQKADPEIITLYRKIKNQESYSKGEFAALSPIGRCYAKLKEEMIIDSHGIVRFKLPETHSPFKTARYVYIVPEPLVKAAIMRTHRQLTHLAAKATFDKLKLHAYFPNMIRRIQQVLMLCGPCQTKTTRLPDQHHTLRSRPIGFPFQTLSLDFVGPFPPSHQKKNIYLLTIKDVFTRWLEAFPLKTATAMEVARILNEEIFARYGKCEQIHSDRGTQFTSGMMNELGELLKIKITQTPAYNPKSNPVERSHREIKAALTALSSNQPSHWDKHIPSILYAIRVSVSRSTGFSPFQLMFGRDPIDDLDTIFPRPTLDKDVFERPQYFQELRDKTIQAFHLARQNMGLAVSLQRRAYYRVQRSFEKGDTVWLFTPILGQRQLTKLHTGWSGPWEVYRKINEVTYEISPTANLKHARREVVSIDRMRRYFRDESELTIDPLEGNEITLEGDFFGEGPSWLDDPNPKDQSCLSLPRNPLSWSKDETKDEDGSEATKEPNQGNDLPDKDNDPLDTDSEGSELGTEVESYQPLPVNEAHQRQQIRPPNSPASTEDYDSAHDWFTPNQTFEDQITPPRRPLVQAGRDSVVRRDPPHELREILKRHKTDYALAKEPLNPAFREASQASRRDRYRKRMARQQNEK